MDVVLDRLQSATFSSKASCKKNQFLVTRDIAHAFPNQHFHAGSILDDLDWSKNRKRLSPPFHMSVTI